MAAKLVTRIDAIHFRKSQVLVALVFGIYGTTLGTLQPGQGGFGPFPLLPVIFIVAIGRTHTADMVVDVSSEQEGS
jgi:hypothetical protein